MGNGRLIYMMVTKESRQLNAANRASSIGKRHTDCPTKCSVIGLHVVAIFT